MLSTSTQQIVVHKLLEGTSGAIASKRIAAGVMRVRRAANAKRRFAVTFAHLGKLNPIQAIHLRDLIDCFTHLIRDIDIDVEAPPMILGLAESGIIPSFAMHSACLELGHLSNWLCTTRSANDGSLEFMEPHSHAPHHYLPCSLLDSPIDSLWIVEDEITSGRTLDNLLHTLVASGQVQQVRVFSLLDMRDAAAVEGFSGAWERKGLQVQVESILSAGPWFWQREPGELSVLAVDDQPRDYFFGETLIEGLPLLLAGELQALQHITLSPWMVDGQHVLSRQQPTPGYYLYNARDLADV